MSTRKQFFQQMLFVIVLVLLMGIGALAEDSATIEQLTKAGLKSSRLHFDETSFSDLGVPLTGQRFPRPIPMGSSISTTPTLPFISAGTAGLRVSSLFNRNLKFILSNNHVMGAVGPTLCPNTAAPGTWILQPGTLDLGFDPGQDPFYLAGILARSIQIDFSPQALNLVDAAIALTSTRLAGNEIHDIGVPAAQLAFPAPGMDVVKSGRATDVTTGTVESVNATIFVDYGAECGTARFVGQTVITPGAFSGSGDSGSAILDQDTNAPVALLFAGGADSTVATPIHFIYLLFGVAPDGITPTSSFSAEELLEKSRQVSPRMKRLIQIQSDREADVLGMRGVHGIGIGNIPGENELGFIIYAREISAGLRELIENRIDGIRVHVSESDEFVAY